MIYLIGCLSMNLVRELNDRSNSKSPPSAHDRIIQRQVQTRRISEEILLTLGSSSVTSSPLTLNLATEILTVQLISITSSCNHTWFNKTLVDLLGSTAPSQASGSSSTSAKSGLTPLSEGVKESVQSGDLQEACSTSAALDSLDNLSDPINAPSNVSEFPDDMLTVLGNDILIAYLKSPQNFHLSTRTNLNHHIGLQDLFNHTLNWTPVTIISALEQENLLRSSPGDSTHAKTLIKLFNHFSSFQETSKNVKLASDVLKVNAISVLSALAPLMNYTIDELLAIQPDQASKQDLCRTWKSVIVETLRRLELSPTIDLDIFGNLQEWILDQLRSIKTNKLNRPSPSSKLEVDSRMGSSEATPVSHQIQKDRIHYMSLPNIPPTTGSSYDGTYRPPSQSQDVASSGPEHTWEKSQSSATEAVLSRHRASSIGRTAISPPTSEGGFSQRRSSLQDPFTSPPGPFQSSNFSQSLSPFSVRLPEEGDMTEGYSLDEADDTGDLDPSHSNQSISHPLSSSASTVSTGLDHLPESSSRSNSTFSNSVTSSPQPASFNVSVTDMSSPSAFEPKTGLIKQKKDLSFLIAVEAPPVPGFIVTRGWPELERMDAAINKKKMIGVGTKAFPRALLPTSLNFKVIDHVIRELEGYLECLLNDERYSKSEPVLKFFAKERSGMNGRGGAMNNIFNTTSSTLDSIGKGVASVGKEVVSKPVDLATIGLNRLSKGVFSGLPFGGSPTASKEATEERPCLEIANQGKSLQSFNSADSRQFSSDASADSSQVGEASQDRTSANEYRTPTNAEHFTNHANGLESNDKKIQEQSLVSDRVEPRTNPRSYSETRLPSDLNSKEGRKSLPSSSLLDREPSNVQRSNTLGPTSKTEPMISSHTAPVPSTVKPSTVQKPVKSMSTVVGTSRPSSTGASLTGKEFDAVIIGLISILEAAYGLDQRGPGSGTHTPWSMKRGVLRVLETILRTTSFSDFIRTHLSQTVVKFDQVETYVELFNSILTGLSANSTQDADANLDDSEENKSGQGTRRKSKKMKSLSSMDSRQSLHSGHSSSSSQSRDQTNHYQSLDNREEQVLEEQSSSSDGSNDLSAQEILENQQKMKETARKLFVDSWSSLKIPLGSNATDVAANKMFDLFQEFGLDHPEERSHQDSKSNGLHSHSHPNHSRASGIEFIIHSLLLDLIRIILLL